MHSFNRLRGRRSHVCHLFCADPRWGKTETLVLGICLESVRRLRKRRRRRRRKGQRSCCVTSTMWAMVGGVGGFYWISVSDNPNLRERRLTVTWLCVSLMKRPQMTHLLYVWYINYTTHILGRFVWLVFVFILKLDLNDYNSSSEDPRMSAWKLPCHLPIKTQHLTFFRHIFNQNTAFKLQHYRKPLYILFTDKCF